MAMKYRENLDVLVEIDVRDPDVLERVTGPNGDEWRAHVYGDIHTEDDVLEHLAQNCIGNGVQRANRLDGWGDLPDDAATMQVIEVESWGGVR